MNALLSIFDEEALVRSEAFFYPAAPDKAGKKERKKGRKYERKKESKKERKQASKKKGRQKVEVEVEGRGAVRNPQKSHKVRFDRCSPEFHPSLVG